jgi:WD40 repeat protein
MTTNIEGNTVFETSSRLVRCIAIDEAVHVAADKDVHVAADNLVFLKCSNTGSKSCGTVNRMVYVDGYIYVATGVVKEFDSNGNPIKNFEGHENGATVYGLAITFCGNFICSGADDKTVRWWNVKTGELIGTFNCDGTVFAVAFSPNGKFICSGSWDNTVRLWNVETGECKTLNGHTNCVRSVAFSPDGKYVCSGSYDKTVRLWNVETGECVHKLEHNGPVNIVAFSPDGKYMCSGTGVTPYIEHCEFNRPVQNGENTAVVYCTTSWKRLYILNTGHKGAVKDIAVSPEGKIYTASEDGKVMCFIPDA